MLAYKTLRHILEKIHVKSPFGADEILMHNNPQFLLSYLHKNGSYHIGGGEDKQYNVKYGTYKFIIYKYDEDGRTTYAIHNNNNLEEDACMVLFYDHMQKMIYIDNISYHPKCTS
jgi:hypothetical protein